jgi:hypothetical protein
MGQLVELQNDEPSGRFHEWWFWADLRQPEMARSTTPWIMFQTPSRIYWDSIISYWDMISYNHLLGFHLEFRECTPDRSLIFQGSKGDLTCQPGFIANHSLMNGFHVIGLSYM